MKSLIISKDKTVSKIDGYPINHGITTRWFGNVNFSQREKLQKQNIRVMENAGADCFHETMPQGGDRVVVICGLEGKINGYHKADGLICLRPANNNSHPVLISETNDSPTVLLSNPGLIIGIIHSGWRSTKKNIVGKTIINLKKAYGLKPKNMIIGLWPGICPLCYKVDNKLKKLFPGYIKKERLDLKNVIVEQLISAGVENKNITIAEKICSAHSCWEGDFLFSSYHRDHNEKKDVAFIAF